MNLLERYEKLYNLINSERTPPKLYQGSDQLVIQYKKISTPTEADVFFAKFGVGNRTAGIDYPFERQTAYENLLEILKQIDVVQYHKIHKGTPYYFISWTAYQYLNFSKSIFYMDAAVSEDLKFPDVQNGTNTRPSLDFFLLNTEPGPSGLPAHIEMRDIVQNGLKSYHMDGGGIISVEDFKNKFVTDLLYSGPENRSILTALFTFLLEYEEKTKQINLRSDTGGSIQPFLDHLFDGARILESLLEKKGGKGNDLLKKIENTPALLVTKNVLKGNKKLSSAEEQYKTLKDMNSSFQERNFASAYIIRNTTGHSLLWTDQFSSADSYRLLFSTLLNSIFWTVEKLWLKQ